MTTSGPVPYWPNISSVAFDAFSKAKDVYEGNERAGDAIGSFVLSKAPYDLLKGLVTTDDKTTSDKILKAMGVVPTADADYYDAKERFDDYRANLVTKFKKHGMSDQEAAKSAGTALSKLADFYKRLTGVAPSQTKVRKR